jgi:tRNA A37 threonylcarbamoyladenosine dehydratase
MLLSGDLNADICNEEIHNIVRRFGEQVINTDRLKLKDFASNNNMKIINSFYKYKNVRTYTWTARNFKTVLDYFIANRRI